MGEYIAVVNIRDFIAVVFIKSLNTILDYIRLYYIRF